MTGLGSGAPDRVPATHDAPRQGTRQQVLIVLAAGLLFRLILAYALPGLRGSGFGPDLGLFNYWADVLAQHSPWGFYANASYADYTPGYLYALWIVGIVRDLGTSLAIDPTIVDSFIKLPAIITDLVLGYLVYSLATELGVTHRPGADRARGRRVQPGHLVRLGDLGAGRQLRDGVPAAGRAGAVARPLGASGVLRGGRGARQAPARDPHPDRRPRRDPAGAVAEGRVRRRARAAAPRVRMGDPPARVGPDRHDRPRGLPDRGPALGAVRADGDRGEHDRPVPGLLAAAPRVQHGRDVPVPHGQRLQLVVAVPRRRAERGDRRRRAVDPRRREEGGRGVRRDRAAAGRARGRRPPAGGGGGRGVGRGPAPRPAHDPRGSHGPGPRVLRRPDAGPRALPVPVLRARGDPVRLLVALADRVRARLDRDVREHVRRPGRLLPEPAGVGLAGHRRAPALHDRRVAGRGAPHGRVPVGPRAAATRCPRHPGGRARRGPVRGAPRGGGARAAAGPARPARRGRFRRAGVRDGPGDGRHRRFGGRRPCPRGDRDRHRHRAGNGPPARPGLVRPALMGQPRSHRLAPRPGLRDADPPRPHRELRERARRAPGPARPVHPRAGRGRGARPAHVPRGRARADALRRGLPRAHRHGVPPGLAVRHVAQHLRVDPPAPRQVRDGARDHGVRGSGRGRIERPRRAGPRRDHRAPSRGPRGRRPARR